MTLTVLHNLPLPLSSFIGREHESSEVKRLLSTARLVTLTGPGGCGKTRLALRVSADLANEYRDGVCWVALASLADEVLVPQAVAAALCIQEQAGQPLAEILTSFLQTRHILLALDNCEHLIAACAHLAETLLHTCPSLCILATSREALNSSAEVCWLVPSLALSPMKSSVQRPMSKDDDIRRHEAVRLFIERAQTALPTFAPNDDDMQLIADVCRRLDGMPLAIELAAARVKVLSLEQIVARLGDCFQLLTHGSRTAAPRQQTLRATMDWSHELLATDEQVLFRRLAVFGGSFTVDAAEATCCRDGIERAEVLNLLARLVDKSLIGVETKPGREAHYRLLETIRQYAAEKLQAAGEEDALRARHRDYYLAFAEEVEPKLTGPEQHIWLERIASEYDNLRAALEWTAAQQDTVTQLRIAGALSWFWWVRKRFTEGQRWLNVVLTTSDDMPPGVRAKALLGAGHVAFGQASYEPAAALYEQSLLLHRALRDKRGAAWSLGLMGVAECENNQLDKAAPLLEQSLALSREVDDRWQEAWVLNQLARIAQLRADEVRGTALAAESLSIHEQLHDAWGLAVSHRRLAELALRRDDHRSTHMHLLESLRCCQAVGDPFNAAACLEDLGELAAAQERAERAARFYGAAEALFEAYGAQTRRKPMLYQNLMKLASAQSNPQGIAAAWAAGRGLTLELAIAYASNMDEERTAAALTQYPAGLTAREIEVLRLVARGVTNQEIADQLVLSKRTVEAHLRTIFGKLDVRTRSSAARVAMEYGLT